MTIVRIRPNGDVSTSGFWTIFGGAASTYAAINDQSDATYLQGSFPAIFDMATASVPVSNDIAAVCAGFRAKVNGSSGSIRCTPYYSGWSGNGPSWSGTSITDVVLTSAQGASVCPGGSLWTQALLNAMQIMVVDQTHGSAASLYELYADVYYFARLTSAAAISGGSPVTSVSKPAFNLTFTAAAAVDSAMAAAAWNVPQYEVRVFNAAQYGAGGFNPSTSAAYWETTGGVTMVSGATTATATVTATTALPNDSYRVYVVSAWNFPAATLGTWAYTAFVMNTVPPNAPSVTAVLDNANGRVTCNVTPIATTGNTNPLITLQRSSDGGATWAAVYGATSLAGTFGTAATLYDYAAPRGIALQYRASIEATYSGNQLTSLWTTVSVTGTIPIVGWNFKVPKSGAMNMLGALVLKDPSYTQTENVTTLRPLGRTFPVTVSLNLGGSDGTMTVMTRTDADWAALTALKNYRAPIFVDSPFGWSRWIRIINRSWLEFGTSMTAMRQVQFDYVEVAADV